MGGSSEAGRASSSSPLTTSPLTGTYNNLFLKLKHTRFSQLCTCCSEVCYRLPETSRSPSSEAGALEGVPGALQ